MLEGNNMISRIGLVAIFLAPGFPALSAEPPQTWIDPDTGHRDTYTFAAEIAKAQ